MTVAHGRAAGRADEMAEPTRSADMSVVVPSVNGWEDLHGCLEALIAQEGDPVLEVIVVDRVGSSVRRPLATEFPRVTLIETASGTTIPAMRAMAFDAATAPIVGVIEDHVIVPPDWARRMLEAHAAGDRVVGGSVENAATQNVVEWASFLCEYSQCLSPRPGPAEWLTGNNVTYRRDLLVDHREVIAEGRWENRLHDALRASGVQLSSEPSIRVGHKKHFGFGEYLSQRYLYARSYAGMRVEEAGVGTRLGYAVASLALPPLLFVRTVRGVLASGRYRAELLRSLPLIAMFVTAWAAGELVGYVAGPGDTLSRVC